MHYIFTACASSFVQLRFCSSDSWSFIFFYLNRPYLFPLLFCFLFLFALPKPLTILSNNIISLIFRFANHCTRDAQRQMKSIGVHSEANNTPHTVQPLRASLNYVRLSVDQFSLAIQFRLCGYT